MVGKLKVSVQGLKELDAALGELSKATAKGVMRRALLKAAQPMVDRAAALAPKDKGDLSASIIAATKNSVEGDAGKRAFGETLRAGGSKAEARAALRSARREAGVGASFVEVSVGPAKAKTKRAAIKAVVQEFGSVKQPPHAYMRPAFAATRDQVLGQIKTELTSEIDKAARRAAARALKPKRARTKRAPKTGTAGAA
ncbi:HK97-gp10 family putative phage morphogenesis protein [Ancylobacter sp. IITR112]|uniref:HK97-gp10 family putative phage morphogenesis protein n=1 Tax=Ancylobacter sp. IITR112 TaxID=3138073 RepID=UPI00352B5F16